MNDQQIRLAERNDSVTPINVGPSVPMSCNFDAMPHLQLGYHVLSVSNFTGNGPVGLGF